MNWTLNFWVTDYKFRFCATLCAYCLCGRYFSGLRNNTDNPFNVDRLPESSQHARIQTRKRIEFSNVINRTYMLNPDSTNAKATQSADPATGQVISGFGRIPTLGATGGGTLRPRSGTFVARLRF